MDLSQDRLRDDDDDDDYDDTFHVKWFKASQNPSQ